MAKFNILSINKMTAGERRGLIDMTISLDYRITDLFLLDAISAFEDSPKEVGLSVAALKDYGRTKYISDFKPAGNKNPLAQEISNVSLVLQED